MYLKASTTSSWCWSETLRAGPWDWDSEWWGGLWNRLPGR